MSTNKKSVAVVSGFLALLIVILISVEISIEKLKKQDHAPTTQQQIAEQNRISANAAELRQTEKGSIVLLLDGQFFVVDKYNRGDETIRLRDACTGSAHWISLKDLAKKTDLVFNYRVGDSHGNVSYAVASNSYNRCERAK
ncbi:MAG: hypothetical protein Q8P07_01170 [bacterium]|nr:hypothetical protein [bacterium]